MSQAFFYQSQPLGPQANPARASGPWSVRHCWTRTTTSFWSGLCLLVGRGRISLMPGIEPAFSLPFRNRFSSPNPESLVCVALAVSDVGMCPPTQSPQRPPSPSGRDPQCSPPAPVHTSLSPALASYSPSLVTLAFSLLPRHRPLGTLSPLPWALPPFSTCPSLLTVCAPCSFSTLSTSPTQRACGWCLLGSSGGKLPPHWTEFPVGRHPQDWGLHTAGSWYMSVE